MTWQPKLDDVEDLSVKQKRLLSKAAFECEKRLGVPVRNPITDKHGTVAFSTHYFILCAHRYVYGNIVSCHEILLEIAVRDKKYLLMYIDDADKFYRFKPMRLLIVGTPNQRAGYTMINFNITEGENIEKRWKDLEGVELPDADL